MADIRDVFVCVSFPPGRIFRDPFSKAPNLWASAQLRLHKRVCRFVLY